MHYSIYPQIVGYFDQKSNVLNADIHDVGPLIIKL